MFESLYQPNCQVRVTLRLGSDLDCQNGCWNLNTAYAKLYVQVYVTLLHMLEQISVYMFLLVPERMLEHCRCQHICQNKLQNMSSTYR